MDIRGEQLGFTPTEAQWAQDTALLFRRAPGIAQKVLRARHAFAAQWLDTSTLPTPEAVTQTPLGVEALTNVLRTNDALKKIEREHATDADGNEQTVITVEFTRREKLELFRLAMRDQQNIQEGEQEAQEIPEVREAERNAILDDAAFAAILMPDKIMSAEEAVELGDLLRDPEYIAAHDAAEREEDARILAVTDGIIRVLGEHLLETE